MNRVLETERLVLRPWEEGDARELHSYASNQRVGLQMGDAPNPGVRDCKFPH